MQPIDLSPTGDFFPLSSLETASWREEMLWGEETLFADGLRGVEGASPLERFAPAWSELLAHAVEEPGLICDAYSRFHGYSLGNRFGALIQCQLRGLEPGPLNSFGGWRKLGYAVKEGERALTLCMPLKGTLHRERAALTEQSAPSGENTPDVEAVEYIRAFVWKPNWFVLSQTVPLNAETQTVPPSASLSWDKAKALQTLGITQVPFTSLDGNALGFARGQTVAVSPLSPLPFKTLFHELGHVVLGHTTPNFRGEGNSGLDLMDGEELSPALIEAEAESVALLCLATLDLPGQEFCRGYIQHWLQHQDIPEKSAQRIFGAADRILSAGSGEVRHRSPTAEEVGLMNGQAQPLSPPEISPADAHGLPTVPSPLPAPSSLPGPLLARSAAALLLPADQPVQTRDGALGAPKSLQAEGISHSLPIGTERDAWTLHAHLQALHDALHPVRSEDIQALDRALRHLYSRDPEGTREVRDLLKGVSRGLKAARGRIEIVLDGLPTIDPQNEEQRPPRTFPSPTPLGNKFDPLTGMVPGEASGNSQPQGTPPAMPLSPPRHAAARRGVGRTLKSELEFERTRFEKAAKEHELPVGRSHDKEMFKAITALLGVPVASRRDLSSHQWARLASAIETEDLLWGKPLRA